MSKKFSITGLTAEHMASIISLVSSDAKLAKMVTGQFTDQMLEVAPSSAPVAEAPAEKAPAAAPKAPRAKRVVTSPMTDDAKRAKRAAAERARRAKKKALELPPPPVSV